MIMRTVVLSSASTDRPGTWETRSCTLTSCRLSSCAPVMAVTLLATSRARSRRLFAVTMICSTALAGAASPAVDLAGEPVRWLGEAAVVATAGVGAVCAEAARVAMADRPMAIPEEIRRPCMTLLPPTPRLGLRPTRTGRYCLNQDIVKPAMASDPDELSCSR